ncbi:hypothetical protein Hanom_Chr01g00032401 [Helianthus anomalus]
MQVFTFLSQDSGPALSFSPQTNNLQGKEVLFYYLQKHLMFADSNYTKQHFRSL